VLFSLSRETRVEFYHLHHPARLLKVIDVVAPFELHKRYWRLAPNLRLACLCLFLALLRCCLEQPPGVRNGNLVVQLAVQDQEGRVYEANLVYGVIFILEISDSARWCRG